MYVNVNKVYVFLNFFFDENRLLDVKDLWDIFLMIKKKFLVKYLVVILYCFMDIFFFFKNIV